MANRAVDRVSLAAALEQIHRYLHGNLFHVAPRPLPLSRRRGELGLRLDALDHALVGPLVVELERGIAVVDHVRIVGIVDHFVVHLKVGAGRYARQPRTHRPAVGKHRVAPLGAELLLLEHVLDRMHRRLGRGLRPGQRNQSEGHQARQESTTTKPNTVFTDFVLRLELQIANCKLQIANWRKGQPFM